MQEEPSAYTTVQNDELVDVVVGEVVEGVSLEVVLVVVGSVSIGVELIVMVVMEVSIDVVGDGHDRSGRLLLLSCRLNFAGAPQPSRASPGCLFPAELSVCSHRLTSREQLTSNHNGARVRTLIANVGRHRIIVALYPGTENEELFHSTSNTSSWPVLIQFRE